MKNEQETNNIHEFYTEIFPYRIWVVVSKDPYIVTEHFNNFENREILEIDEDTEQLAAFVMRVVHKDTQKIGSVIFFRNKASMSYELVAHEATHAAKNLFEFIGADINPIEPFEHTIGWIAGCCDSVRKSKVKTALNK